MEAGARLPDMHEDPVTGSATSVTTIRLHQRGHVAAGVLLDTPAHLMDVIQSSVATDVALHGIHMPMVEPCGSRSRTR